MINKPYIVAYKHNISYIDFKWSIYLNFNKKFLDLKFAIKK